MAPKEKKTTPDKVAEAKPPAAPSTATAPTPSFHFGVTAGPDNALHKAAAEGDVQAVEQCLKDTEAGARAPFEHLKSITALHLAARGGHESVARLLLDRKANVDARCGPDHGEDETPLSLVVTHATSATAHQEPMVKLLIERKADVNARTYGSWDVGKTPLQSAVERCNVGLTRLLLAQRADPEVPRLMQG